MERCAHKIPPSDIQLFSGIQSEPGQECHRMGSFLPASVPFADGAICERNLRQQSVHAFLEKFSQQPRILYQPSSLD
jgi:hypothetical protein